MKQYFIEERRENKRYYTNEGTFVNASKNFGRIVDISLGGMKFHYLNWVANTDLEGKLDIYLNGEDILTDVHFVVLPDATTPKVKRTNKVTLKQCRVQFTQLNNTQKSKLEHFILHQTSGTA